MAPLVVPNMRTSTRSREQASNVATEQRGELAPEQASFGAAIAAIVASKRTTEQPSKLAVSRLAVEHRLRRDVRAHGGALKKRDDVFHVVEGERVTASGTLEDLARARRLIAPHERLE